MAQPSPYERDFDFEAFQTSHPSTPIPADKVNGELDAVGDVIEAILARVADLQRDDRQAANKLIGYDQLKDELRNGFGTPTVWAPSTAYAVGAVTYVGRKVYGALAAHTSAAAFNVDFASGRWHLLADFTEVAAVDGDASAARDEAILARDAAQSYAADSASSAGDAAAAVDTVAASVSTALGHADTAEKWASEDEDVEVSGGRFSALHWAAKAEATVADRMATSTYDPDGIGASAFDPANHVSLPALTAALARPVQNKLMDLVSIKDFGAVGDGTLHPLSEFFDTLGEAQAHFDFVTALTQSIDWAAVQAAVNWAKTRNGAVFCPAGQYVMDNEVDFTGITTPVEIFGAGVQSTSFYVLPFGADKKLFKGANTDTDTRPMQRCVFRDFEIQGRNSGNTQAFASRSAPMGIFLPYSTSDRIFNVVARSLGNTPFWTCSANNTRLFGCEAFGCGAGVTQDDALSTGATFSTTSGSNVITASAAVFNAGHVGRNIHIYQATALASGPGSFNIVSVDSATQITVDRNAQRTVSGAAGTLEHMRVSANNTFVTITAEADTFLESDVGRFIYIEGAGDTNGGWLVTTIETYVSPTQVQLADPAGRTVSNAFFTFSPSHYHGQVSADSGDTRGLNDIQLEMCLTEAPMGIGYFFGPGVNIEGKMLKCHGFGTGGLTRAGRQTYSYVFDSCRAASIETTEVSYGYTRDSGNILICGGRGNIAFGDFLAGALPETQPFFHVSSGSADTMLVIKDGHINKDFTVAEEPDWIRFSNGRSYRNVFQSGKTTTRNLATVKDVGAPVMGRAFRTYENTLADDTVHFFRPTTDQGFLLVWTNGSTEGGLVYYRCTSSPACVKVSGGADLSVGTTELTDGTGDGVDGHMNVAATDDGIYFKNRAGATRSLGYFLAG